MIGSILHRSRAGGIGRAAGLLPLLLLAGCDPGFDPATLLNKVRILGVKADPPEVAPDASTKLTALLFPPGDASLSLEWALCTLQPTPSSGDLVNPDCLDNDTADFLVQLGGSNPIDFTMPELALTDLGVPDTTGGFYVPLRVRLHGTYGDQPPVTVQGVYRLRYHIPMLPLAPNQNPELTAVYAVPDENLSPPDAGASGAIALEEATPMPIARGASVTLRAVLGPGSVETYVVPGGTPQAPTFSEATERVDFQWYSTAGTFVPERTGPDDPDTRLTLGDNASLPAPGATIDVWVIARDDRGGVDWQHRLLVYQP